MDGLYRRRIPLLLICTLVVASAGCAEFGAMPSWSPFQRQKATEVPDIPSPAERIALLQKLADQGARASEQKIQHVSADLARAIETEEDPLIRAEIVRTLGEYPCATADTVLGKALNDPETEVRVIACQAWGKRGNAEAANMLAETLRSDVDVDVRLAAARALGRTKDPAATTALGEALEDRDPAIQYRAVLSLQKVTGEDFGNDVNAWRQYVRGEPQRPVEPVSIAERLRRIFY